MREILFRAKGKLTNGWIYNDLFHYDKQDFVTADNRVTAIYPETLGQFTGLTDKNGTKIFEGDIVKYAGEIHRVVFEFKNGAAYFGIEISKIETWGFCYGVPTDKMEVIGNIFDNPELLEVQK